MTDPATSPSAAGTGALASLALTLIGTDRPGLIDRVATVAAEHGANWLESHMANLAGRFAGIVHLEVEAARVDGLRRDFEALARDGLELTLVDADATVAEPVPGTLLSLDITGHDHPGIVRAIAHALAELGVSIDALETRREHASWSGESLFRAEAVLRLPEALGVDAVQACIEALSGEIMVDARVGEAGGSA